MLKFVLLKIIVHLLICKIGRITSSEWGYNGSSFANQQILYQYLYLHNASEMRIKIYKDIIENNRKVYVFVDKLTTLSKKTMLVICLSSAN